MPRPLKKRYVCHMPANQSFFPGEPREAECVRLAVDEYETVRLLDLEEYTQEECAQQMGVSRTTIQGMYDSARRKIADALVNGKKLEIAGGEYVVCNRFGKHCPGGCQKHCGKHSAHLAYFQEAEESEK